ncbi:MAG TPA: alpha-1,4-glucan--maltose-1-phosphate maltosyltransferase [Xanthobacteraceae bacterium]|nr:alpha-1,4-glucan--maltose-1-phosphate maltosyltransferase [Xanthobacteraceae bacterium]
MDAFSVPRLDAPRFFIEDVFPAVDGGRFPVKRIVGETVEVWADILREGHDTLGAALLWAREDEPWQSTPMRLVENDRWCGAFTPTALGRYRYAIAAWTDTFATWRHGFLLKQAAGQSLDVEAQEGRALLAAAQGGSAAAQKIIRKACRAFDASGDPAVLLAEDLMAAMAEAEPRPDLARSPSFPLMVERERARSGAWYEIFPRSQSFTPGRHGTFADCIARVPDIAAQGYDVLYLTPIHPIGRTNRKGRNNALRAEPGDPGSPYAIGAEEGGHDAVHPALGTLEDFRRLVAACARHGMEIALDFATQCSPDHPWLKQHPEWFRRRPDGSIKYAENPPKKYEDIHNPDFYCEDRAGLWGAFRDVVQFWVDQGVRIFRVDNPHTKPFPFWEWLIADVQRRHPDVIFLSEAFTRPKIMKALAKLGFSQSYTYFTWRTTKAELSAYMIELTDYPERDYFRPNFFVNTPDILPFHLQGGEPWMFKARVALAATLSSNYGVYSGFELLEHEPLGPGREEYLNSEKYEIKTRDWSDPRNISGYIARLNTLRRENAALRQTGDFRFAQVDDEQVIGFLKESVGHDNAVAVAIALAGGAPRTFWYHFGDLEIGPPGARKRVAAVENLQTGERLPIEWGGVRLTIDPNRDPALLFRCLA